MRGLLRPYTPPLTPGLARGRLGCWRVSPCARWGMLRPYTLRLAWPVVRAALFLTGLLPGLCLRPLGHAAPVGFYP